MTVELVSAPPFVLKDSKEPRILRPAKKVKPLEIDDVPINLS